MKNSIKILFKNVKKYPKKYYFDTFLYHKIKYYIC